VQGELRALRRCTPSLTKAAGMWLAFPTLFDFAAAGALPEAFGRPATSSTASVSWTSQPAAEWSEQERVPNG